MPGEIPPPEGQWSNRRRSLRAIFETLDGMGVDSLEGV
jgi:hypothetical protein